MKKIVLMMTLFVLTLSACQNGGQTMKKTGEITKETAVVENKQSDGILIAYLPDSSSSQDYIGEIAHIIQEVTGGSVMNIDGESGYPEECGTVFLGLASNQPQLPESMQIFLENNDLSEKTLIPFYMMSRESQEIVEDVLYEMEPDAEFLDGLLLNPEELIDLESEVEGWLSGLGYNRQ